MTNSVERTGGDTHTGSRPERNLIRRDPVSDVLPGGSLVLNHDLNIRRASHQPTKLLAGCPKVFRFAVGIKRFLIRVELHNHVMIRPIQRFTELISLAARLVRTYLSTQVAENLLEFISLARLDRDRRYHMNHINILSVLLLAEPRRKPRPVGMGPEPFTRYNHA